MEDEMIEKFSVALLRSKLSQELKNYLDLTEMSTMPRYLIKIVEWERCSTGNNIIFKQKGRPNQYRQAPQNSFKKSVTCFHCGKVGHIS